MRMRPDRQDIYAALGIFAVLSEARLFNLNDKGLSIPRSEKTYKSLKLTSWAKLTGSDAIVEKSKPLSPLDINRTHNAIFSEALELLESIKTSPSCNRVAARRLVTECQTLAGDESGDPDANDKLDVVRSVYAARLAICELDGAGASTPSACLSLTASPVTQRSIFRFETKSTAHDTETDVFPREVLEKCLKALESRAQWWTSYSNNKQNAMVICQASRMEAEREQLLNRYRSVVESYSKLNEGIQTTQQKADMEAQRNEAFLRAVRELQDKLTTDMEKSQSIFQDLLAGIVRNVEASFQSVMGGITSSLKVLHGNLIGLEKNVQNVSLGVNALERALQKAHEDSVARDNQALQVHRENSLAQHDLALNIRRSLEWLANRDLASISETMAQLDKYGEWLTTRFALALEAEAEVAKRLTEIDKGMQKFEKRASDIHKAQELQADALLAHSKALGDLQLSAQVSQALIEQTSVKAENLYSIIEDAAKKAHGLPILGIGLTDTGVVILGLIIVIIATRSPFMAIGISFLIIGHSIALAIFPYLKFILPHR